MDIVNVLRRSIGSECSDRRDHVYALLGMSSTSISSHGGGHDTDKDKNVLIVHFGLSAALGFQHLAH